jgi:hypothetical protein
MNRYSVIASIALVLAAGYIWYQQWHIAELKSGVFERDRIFERDKECATQAQKRFVEWKEDQAVPGSYISHTSHYNGNLQTCFMRLNDFRIGTGVKFDDATVVDAFEGVEYAHYREASAYTGENFHLYQCHVAIPGKPARQCSSKKEWEDLVFPLMGGMGGNQP